MIKGDHVESGQVVGDRQRVLHQRRGQELTLGVRPEDLRLASSADSSELSFDSVVEVVEQLGSETLLDVKVGPCAMVAAVPPMVGVKIRDRMRLALNPARLHFFDNKTGAAAAAIGAG